MKEIHTYIMHKLTVLWGGGRRRQLANNELDHVLLLSEALFDLSPSKLHATTRSPS